MRCKNAKILISASMDGELSQREERVLRRHVRHCAECAREQAEVSNLRDVMSVWADEEPSEWLAQSFAYRLQDEMERRPARRTRRPRRVFGTALAGFATALLAFGILMHSQLFPPENSVQTHKPTVNNTQPVKPNHKPAPNENRMATVPPKPDSEPVEEHVVAPPKPETHKHVANTVRTPVGPRTVSPRPNSTPAPPRHTGPTVVAAANTGPSPLTGRTAAMVASNSGSRTRDNLASRGSSSRDAEVKRMILRKLARASSVEDDTEVTVAAQLAKADLTMNESVEQVRGLLCRAADNLAHADYRTDIQ